jgi:hypothetical protein
MDILKTKKYHLMEWIMSIADENVIDRLQAIKLSFENSANKLELNSLSYTVSTYDEIKSRKVDVSQLKEDQNYKATTSQELSSIAHQAGIQESIEDLLTDLKEMG